MPGHHGIKIYSAVAISHLILAIFFTYPLFLHPARTYIEPPLGGSNDQFLGMWDAWWLKKSLFDLHTSPFSTRYLFFPEGADLSLHELTIVNSLLTIPFQSLLPKPNGVVLGFNIAVLLSFVLAGVGMYALLYYLTRNPLASYACSLVYALAPYRTLHIIHIALLSMGWFPLYTFFLLKTLQEPRFRHAVLAALMVVLTLYSCISYAYFTLLLTGIVLFYFALFERKQFFDRRVLICVALLGLLGAIAVTPQTVIALRAGSAHEQPYELTKLFGANGAGYVVPAWKHVFYRPILRLFQIPDFSGIPGDATFLGFTTLALAVVGIFRVSWRKWAMWFVVAVFFFILSLGPNLHLFSSVYEIKLPYAFFHKYLPFFGVMRTPYRFVVFANMGCAVLACYGLDALALPKREEGELRGRKSLFSRKSTIPIIVACLLMLELWNQPFSATEAEVPAIYFDIGSEENGFGILDLPRSYHKVAAYMFYQTVHEKPIVAGLISRTKEQQNQVGRILSSQKFWSPGALSPGDLAKLKEIGFRYIIYHSPERNENALIAVIRLE